MSAVFFTLKEAAYLWVRNFWYIALISVVVDAPVAASAIGVVYLVGPLSAHPHVGSHVILVAATTLLFAGVLSSVKIAAIFGILRRRLSGRSPVDAVFHSIGASTWSIFFVTFLLGLCGLPLLGLGRFLTMLLGGRHIVSTTFHLLFRFWLKFALPDAFVTQEGAGALSAIAGAFRLTLRHLGYVLACYFLLAVGVALIEYVIRHLVMTPVSWISFVGQLVSGLIETSWIVLSWCIYLHLKDQENPAAEGHLEPSAD